MSHWIVSDKVSDEIKLTAVSQNKNLKMKQLLSIHRQSKQEPTSAWQDLMQTQAIVAAIFLINGGVYAFKFPYPTIPSIISSSEIFTLSFAVLAIAATILLIEFKLVPSNSMAKTVFYAFSGILSLSQLTLLQPAVFLIIIAAQHFVHYCFPSPVLPK